MQLSFNFAPKTYDSYYKRSRRVPSHTASKQAARRNMEIVNVSDYEKSPERFTNKGSSKSDSTFRYSEPS
jgi:hypothetical protein